MNISVKLTATTIARRTAIRLGLMKARKRPLRARRPVVTSRKAGEAVNTDGFEAWERKLLEGAAPGE